MLIIGFLCVEVNAFACNCDVPKPAVEFAYSDYVFEGVVSSKKYAADSLTYTITFEVTKHYKFSNAPAQLDFTLRSEGEFTGEWTSCDWSVNENQKWLIYARRYNGKLTFSFYCSNSKPIQNREVEKSEQGILNNGNELDLDKYVFSMLDGFYSKARPKANLDSILSLYQKNSYQDERIDIIVDIDQEGDLKAANLWSKTLKNRPLDKVIDSIFNLNKPPNIKVREPDTRAERDLLKLVRGLKKWDKTYLPFSNTPVAYRMYLQFYPEQDTIKLYY